MFFVYLGFALFLIGLAMNNSYKNFYGEFALRVFPAILQSVCLFFAMTSWGTADFAGITVISCIVCAFGIVTTYRRTREIGSSVPRAVAIQVMIPFGAALLAVLIWLMCVM